jgi:hypothetical protein
MGKLDELKEMAASTYVAFYPIGCSSPVIHSASLAYDNAGQIFLGDPCGSVAALEISAVGGELEGGHRFLVTASSAENRRRLIGVTANEVVSGNDNGVCIFDRHEGFQTDTLTVAKPGQWVSTVAVSPDLIALASTDSLVDWILPR